MDKEAFGGAKLEGVVRAVDRDEHKRMGKFGVLVGICIEQFRTFLVGGCTVAHMVTFAVGWGRLAFFANVVHAGEGGDDCVHDERQGAEIR